VRVKPFALEAACAGGHSARAVSTPLVSIAARTVQCSSASRITIEPVAVEDRLVQSRDISLDQLVLTALSIGSLVGTAAIDLLAATALTVG